MAFSLVDYVVMPATASLMVSIAVQFDLGGSYWILLNDCYIGKDISDFYRVLLGFTGFYRVLPGLAGLQWFFFWFRVVLPSFTGFNSAFC